MQEERIRLSGTNSVKSVDKNNLVDVELQHHTRLFPFSDVKETINEREVFEKERSECTKYRLITTINPYCSNILFNALTEVVRNEGTDKPSELQIASDNNDISLKSDVVRGKYEYLKRIDFIRNTEYSGLEKPFVYHCGFDIFNNHTLRKNTFKVVNKLKEGTKSEVRNEYNTIRDYMRYENGDDVMLYKRNSLDGELRKPTTPRHLYQKDDILKISDSIDANLFENFGWFGFANRSTICVGEKDKETNKFKPLGNHKTINDDGSEFIEMYPDSSLYSFNPKYNNLQNREEHNWDICLTYPYENESGVDNILINGVLEGNSGNLINALLLASAKQVTLSSGQDVILFRSYVKHGLKVGDEIKLFFGKNTNAAKTEYKEIASQTFLVRNVGDLKNNNREYYFYIDNQATFLESLGVTEYKGNYSFRFIKLNNGIECKYYIRKFKKIPNFKFKKEMLNDDILSNKEKFVNYIERNCKRGGKMIGFSKEIYPLAFSQTVYSDKKTQITFTDSIDIDKIRDNIGRPLTEIFLTIIKRNKGYGKWYNVEKSERDLKEIEFSHCFGELSCGFLIDSGTTKSKIDLFNRRKLSDVTTIGSHFGVNKLGENEFGIPLKRDIKIDDDVFYGDLVEFEPFNIKENVLTDVNFRFNTNQRDMLFSEKNNILSQNQFIVDEILTDDYDFQGFLCEEYNLKEKNLNYRPEGYYYKPHYPISVRDFGDIQQGSHKEIMVVSCRPKQVHGMFIEVVSSRIINAVNGAKIYLCDDYENLMIPLSINGNVSSVRFLINPMSPTDNNYKSVFDIVSGLRFSTIKIKNVGEEWVDENGDTHIAESGDVGTTVDDYSKQKYKLRFLNEDIPNYAYKVDDNHYIWRDVVNKRLNVLNDKEEYPFANGHFYIMQDINFYLKRQDPYGYNGLYDKDKWPSDIFGKHKKVSYYEYKDEKLNIC